MRVLAFLLFFSASFLCLDSLITFTRLTSEERLFFATTGEDPFDQSEIARLDYLQAEAAIAAKGRRLLATKSAVDALVLSFLGFVIVRKWYPAKVPSFGLPGQVTDIDRLMKNVKWRSPLRQQVTHFYEARRVRCQAARARLASKIDDLFGTASDKLESSAHQDSRH